MIEVFKTNIEPGNQCLLLIERLQEHMPACRISFDLEDCDRILRIAGEGISPLRVIEILLSEGFQCAVLD